MKKEPLLVIITLAFLLRLMSANQSLWLDEATTALVARDHSLESFFKNFIVNDFHPPLYYLTIKAWSYLAGYSEFALRLPSIIFGVLTVYVTAVISENVIKKSGYLSALILATSPLHIYYSQEARMYSMQTLLAALLILFYIKSDTNKKYWPFFSLTALSLAFTDYLPTLVLIPIFVHTLLLRRKSIIPFLVSLTPIAIVMIFYLPILRSQMDGARSVKEAGSQWWSVLGQISIKNILLIPIKFALGRINFTPRALYGLAILVTLSTHFAILVKATLVKTKDTLGKNTVIILWLLTPVLASIFISMYIPVLSYFRLIFVIPAYCILLSLGLITFNTRLFPPLASVVIALNLIFSLTYLTKPAHHRENWRAVSKYVSQQSSNQIVFPSTSQHEALTYYVPNIEVVNPDDINDKSEKIIYINYVSNITDPEGTTRGKIESLGYKQASEYNFNGINVLEYKK